jgi:hypothetical protein
VDLRCECHTGTMASMWQLLGGGMVGPYAIGLREVGKEGGATEVGK